MRLFSIFILACTPIFLSCQHETSKAEKASDSGDLSTTPMDVQQFAEICKVELGLPPTPLPPLSCTAGLEVPIYIHGVEPTPEDYSLLQQGELGCDNPTWLNSEEPCANYSFLSRVELSESVIAMLFCRKRGFSNPLSFDERLSAYENEPTKSKFEDLYYFDTVGLIWTNTETGKSCFFDNKSPNFYAGVMPSPDNPNSIPQSEFPEPLPNESDLHVLAEIDPIDVWRRPVDTKLHARCYFCHDSGPFIRTPHIANLGLVPPHQPWLPHQVILPEVGLNIELAEVGKISTTDVQMDTGAEPQLCTSCHSIGKDKSCQQFIGFYTGQMTPPSQIEGLPLHEQIQMPPIGENESLMTEAEYSEHWEQSVRPHLDKLQCCCEDPDAIGCIQYDLRVQNAEAQFGDGPFSCE